MLSNLSLNKLFTLQNSDCLLNNRVNAYLVKLLKITLCCLGLLLNSFAFALAPVVDAYDDDEDETPTVTHSTHSITSNNASSNVTGSSSVSGAAANPSPSTTPAIRNNSAAFSLEQRVTILERQMANLNPMLVRVDDLQQQLQNLQGKIEAQQHAIKVLEEQIRNQYLAIEKRLVPQTHQSTFSTEKFSNVINPSINTTLSPRPLVNLSGAKKETSNNSKSMLPASVPTPAAERAYQNAFQLLKTKQYNEAIDAFEIFNKKFPHDLNVANADYFLGQLYLLQGKSDSAINFFKRFISRYNQDSRVPDAMLQCGLAYFAKGDKTMAMELFEKIIQQYPDSKAAQAAQARLQQFKAMISAANISSRSRA